MNALAAVLAYLGTLAFVAFSMRVNRKREITAAMADIAALYARVLQVEHTLASPPKPTPLDSAPCFWDERRVKKLEDTVSVLAIGAGLRAKGPAEAPKG